MVSEGHYKWKYVSVTRHGLSGDSFLLYLFLLRILAQVKQVSVFLKQKELRDNRNRRAW